MAKGEKPLPDAITKRDMVFGGQTPSEQLIELGDRYMAHERYYDALDCFAQAKAIDRIEKLAQIALEDGDAALFQETLLARGIKAEPDVWRMIAQRAEELGKFAFAEFAYRMAGDEAKLLEYEQRRERERFIAQHKRDEQQTRDSD